MRIERLAEENRRTQGAARRAWYRGHSPEHLEAVAALMEAVLAARGADASPTAVVLGAGACTELPLERLARACERVTLVDLDAPGMGAARDELPATLRGRVHLLAADVTGGVSAALARELRAQPWDDLRRLGGPRGYAPLDAAAACLEECPVPNPPELPGLAPGGYGLVISGLVLTQLFSLPLLDVRDTLSVQAPAVAALRDAYPRSRTAAMAFRRRVALAHLHLLGTLLAPQGAGLLLTDVTGHLLPPRGGPHAGEGIESLDVLPAAALEVPADLEGLFAVVGPLRRWRWLVTAPTGDAPGRAYECAGVVLRRR
jgi:hypothetical protein